MGKRRGGRNLPRPRSRLIAGRELRQAISAEQRGEHVQTFGVRLPAVEQDQDDLLSLFRMMKDDGALPDKVNLRPGLWNTLVPRKLLAGQVAQGIVLGYELRRRSPGFLRDLQQSAPEETIPAIMREPLVEGRRIGYGLSGHELIDLHSYTRLLLGDLGIKGAMKEPRAIHMTCLDVERGQKLSRVEKRFTADVLNVIKDELQYLRGEEVTPNPVVNLAPIEIYPANVPRE